MVVRQDIEAHLSDLRSEALQRAGKHGYAADRSMPAGFGLRKSDCNLVITSLGSYLGFQVFGKRDWTSLLLGGQHNPCVDGPEIPMPYPGTARGHSDYAWIGSAGDTVAIFEVDGRDNSPSYHLPVTPGRPGARTIKQHIKPGAPKNSATNNLFKLSQPVVSACPGRVPVLRCWVLYQVNGPPITAAKRPWGCSPAHWRNYFTQCADLQGAIAVGDWELFEDVFVDAVCSALHIP